MVRWTFPARNDLRQIHAYIAKDSRYYAKKVVYEIVTSVKVIAECVGRLS